jgi:hypothetical protein
MAVTILMMFFLVKAENIKMDVRDTECEGTNWTEVALNRVRSRTFAHTVIHL